MTSYGTIPTHSQQQPPSSFVERTKERIQSSFGEQRPWKDMIQVHSFNLPSTLNDSIERIRTNVAFFRMNYALIILFLIFLSLLWSPISLVLLLVVMLLWLFLYFLREDPLMVFGRVVDDRVVMTVLLMATIAVLFLTDVTSNITVGLCVGLAVILAHGALTTTEDFFPVEDDGGVVSATLTRGRGSVAPLPLKSPASSSFTSS